MKSILLPNHYHLLLYKFLGQYGTLCHYTLCVNETWANYQLRFILWLFQWNLASKGLTAHHDGTSLACSLVAADVVPAKGCPLPAILLSLDRT